MAAPTIEALDPTKGRGFVERFVPLLIAVATVGVSVAAILGFVPGMGVDAGLALLLGTGGGVAIRSQG